MPHDGLDNGASATVVQAIVGTGALGTQATTPQGGCTAPAGANVVFHHQAMLDHVGVWPDSLVGISGKHLGTLPYKEVVGVTNLVVSGSP